MQNGKIMHRNHIVDLHACRYLQSIFPTEWIQRTITPDYGLDIDLELFGFENGVCITLGEHVYLQVKGTEHANYGLVPSFGKKFSDDTDDNQWPVLKFSIDVSELRLVERMGNAIPVLLVVVDLKKDTAFYICLNDYIRHVLPYQNPNFRNQETVTIYIPTANTLTAETSDICLWYGKRAKLFAMFLELLTIVDNSKYLDVQEFIVMMRLRLSTLVNSDAWHASNHWKLLESMHSLIIDTLRNDLINAAGNAFIQLEGSEDCPPNEIMVDYRGELVDLYTAAQSASCHHLLEQLSAAASLFEDEILQTGLPTHFNFLMTK